jgi:uncharacterized protein (DUF433 family)
VDDLAAKGRDPIPKEVRLTTYTLQYPGASWVEIEGLGQHWERAEVSARLEGQKIIASTTNVTSLRLNLKGVNSVVIDNQNLKLSKSAQRNGIALRKDRAHWSTGTPGGDLRKQPGLTGPIDDAFMSEFLFVSPSGFALNDRVGAWASGELTSAVKMWRDIFRGDVPAKKDTEVTDDDIKSNNLILWGDPYSNRVLRRVLRGLPIKWTKTTLYVLKKRVVFVDPETQAPREIVSGQYAIGIVLKAVISDTKRDVERFRERPREKIGHIERHRQTVQNAPVLAGTRIPTAAIKRFHEAGYTTKQIIEQYPDLTEKDIEAALAHEKKIAAA